MCEKASTHTRACQHTQIHSLYADSYTHDQDALVIKLQLQSFCCIKMMQMSDKVYYIW